MNEQQLETLQQELMQCLSQHAQDIENFKESIEWEVCPDCDSEFEIDNQPYLKTPLSQVLNSIEQFFHQKKVDAERATWNNKDTCS